MAQVPPLDVGTASGQHVTDEYHVTGGALRAFEGMERWANARTDMRAAADRSGTLLYDEDCGICVMFVGWLADRVAPARLRLLGLSRAAEDSRIGALVEGRPLAVTIHFVRSDDTISTGARALLAAVRLVRGWRFLAIMFDHRAGHVVLEPLYRQVASHRRDIGRLLGAPAACAVPRAGGHDPTIT